MKEVLETHKYIKTLINNNKFKKLQIEIASENKGLAKSVIYGVSKIINSYECVIVLEDDLVTSRYFLKYMNEALDYYKENKKIWSISGYNLPIEIPLSYKEDVYLSYRACSWGWATWKDRWDLNDWAVKDYDLFKKNRKSQRLFNRGGLDMSNMLECQMAGKIDSWAIRWGYSQYKNDMYTIYPVKSLIKNIGLDGSGTHSGINPKYDIDIEYPTYDLKLANVEFNKVILKRFKVFNMSYLNYALIKPKKIIKKIIGWRK